KRFSRLPCPDGHLLAFDRVWELLSAFKGQRRPNPLPNPQKRVLECLRACKRRDRHGSKTGSTAMRECWYRSPQVDDRT
ncbi:TPA: hypothetical protein ACN304_004616, partial [Vibrio parahaemolyticus]